MENRPKYSLLEIERRWLADPEAAGDFNGLPQRTIEDHYLTTSRLRLRRINEPGKGTIFKLTKKYGKCTRLSESLTNLYLTEDEYHLLRRLPGRSAVKQRYAILVDHWTSTAARTTDWLYSRSSLTMRLRRFCMSLHPSLFGR